MDSFKGEAAFRPETLHPGICHTIHSLMDCSGLVPIGTFLLTQEAGEWVL